MIDVRDEEMKPSRIARLRLDGEQAGRTPDWRVFGEQDYLESEELEILNCAWWGSAQLDT